MRVCVQSGLLRLYPLDLALRTIREAGYDGVELWGGQPHGYILPKRADQLLRESRAYLDGILPTGAEGRAR